MGGSALQEIARSKIWKENKGKIAPIAIYIGLIDWFISFYFIDVTYRLTAWLVKPRANE